MDLKYKATILIVEGAAGPLALLEELLTEQYHLLPAFTGADAIRLAQEAPQPDLILLGMALPDMDAFTVFNEIKCNFLSADIPVVFLTAAAHPQDERRAMRGGANDVVTVPFAPETLLARIGTHVQLRLARGLLKDQQIHFTHLVAERTREIVHMQDATVLAMASLAESRDPDTGNHIRRTQHYVAALARELRFNHRHTTQLTDENIALLFKAAPLHDIGKVGVPDAILNKPGKLTNDEFEIMKLHTVYGRDAIAGVERTLGASNQFLRFASEIAYSHQEHWDGSGYPQGLTGHAIPLSARLMAVADVYDALISERSYRPAFTHETAVELIRQESGEHFDPDVVDAMLAVEEKFMAIAAQFQVSSAAAE
ncbi:MAG: HD domain-containing phosphohydrolase [Pseudomonadota bacterium]